MGVIRCAGVFDAMGIKIAIASPSISLENSCVADPLNAKKIDVKHFLLRIPAKLHKALVFVRFVRDG